MSGGGGSSTTVQRADPWSGQQPYLSFGFQQAQQNYLNQPQYYPGRTYVPFSSQTETGLGMLQNRAMNGSPVEGAFQNYVTGQLGGQSPNPYLNNFMSSPSLGATNAFSGVSSGPMNAARNELSGVNAPSFSGMMNQANAAPGFANNALARNSNFQVGGPGSGPGYAANTLQGLSQLPGMSPPGSVGYAQNALQRASNPWGMGSAQSSAGVGTDPMAAAGNANPFLDQMYNSAASRLTENFNDSVLPGIHSSFANAGGSNSGIQRELATDAAGELSQSLGQMAANMYGTAYENDRNRALQAGQQDIQRRGLANELFLGSQGQSINAANAAMADANQRFGLGADLYLGGRGQALGAASQAQSNDLGRYQAGTGARLQAAGLGTQSALGALSDDLNRFNAGGSLYSNLLNSNIAANQSLMSDDIARRNLSSGLYGLQGNLGLGAVGAMGDYGRMLNQTAALAPTAAGLDYQNIQNLMGAGGMVEDKAREVLGDDMSRWQYAENIRRQQLADYISAIQGNYGGTSVSEQDMPQGSRLAGAAGGGLAGLGTAGALGLGASPWMWPIVGAGALLGAFG